MREPAHSGQDALAGALAELRAGRIDEAEALCRALHASSPQDPALHQLAATIALQRGDADAALRWARSGLALRPDHAPALIVAGRAARAAGDLTQAARWFRRAIELAPDRPEPAFLACVVLLERGDAEARPLLERLLRQFPDDANGWGEIGGALRKAGQLEAAAVALARAAKASDDPSHHNRHGAVLQALGRPGEAIVAFRRALAAAPDLVEPRLALAACLRQTGEPGMARAELERATGLAAGDSRLWFALGLVCEDLRDRPGAIAAYRSCVEEQPDFPEAHVNLGLNLQQSGDLAAAIDCYGRAVRLRADAFGRVSQALTSASKGQLWLNLGRLRRSFGA
jgi:tetratricopeptide (TPR) repeat protein